MQGFRFWIRDRRWLAFGLVLFALAVRALVPQGYMPTATKHVLTVQICADASGLSYTRQMALPDRQPDHQDGHDHHVACAFASHVMPLLGGADAPLLLAALLFILVAAFLPVAPARPAYPMRLRPPLRAPPACS
ncbi:DUF2946 family protein [Novosphingobium sp. Fuku2-ISO-50]|uniref:DUF2946 family protein n=1 Tax=Novosphingobium sp. Fuku2-ISO-50 TaxID=1739114 RepID=UPI00076CB249|nr:DUF2946 family protein [Novosphingobium sp. Fuku2-ISO-50]KUR70989.1 hypothetical protein AQZ50_19770 [Novosphingobium sp. Fuku2-ISO-50]